MLQDELHSINVGIFSIFGKKRRDPGPASTKGDSASAVPDSPALQSAPLVARQKGDSPSFPQRDAAWVTHTKIDAIESEMSDQLDRSRLAPGGKGTMPSTSADADSFGPGTEDILPPLGIVTNAGELTGNDAPDGKEPANARSSQLMHEAAVLFANRQNGMARQLLLDAVAAGEPGSGNRTAWLTLLDFYEALGQQESFKGLAAQYAVRFGVSPPAWRETPPDAAAAAREDVDTPAVVFSGRLDATIIKSLEQLHRLAVDHPTLRLEFTRIDAVDPVGCGLLRRSLQRLRKTGLKLIVAGAANLADQIGAIVQAGRRAETDAPWLLWLDLLRLLGREQEFDAASMAFCATFEVSPPSFDPPDASLILAENGGVSQAVAGIEFPMPEIISNNIGALIDAIAGHAALHQPLVLDCKNLRRVEFSAAGLLLDGLGRLYQNGMQIELRDVSHLVAALFRVVAVEQFARITVRGA